MTNLVEIAQQETKTTVETVRHLRNQWLSRCPRAFKFVTDDGPEFAGAKFEFMLMDAGIKRGRISLCALMADSVVEASHKAMGQIVCKLVAQNPPESREKADQPVDNALATAMHASRCAFATTLLGCSLGTLVFGWDMHLNMPVMVDRSLLTHNHQELANDQTSRENVKQSNCNCKIGNMVVVSNHHSSADKLLPAFIRPFKIVQVHANNTVTVKHGHAHEQLSFRRIKLSKSSVTWLFLDWGECDQRRFILRHQWESHAVEVQTHL